MVELRQYQTDIASRAAKLLHSHKMCYLAMECRTGKTLTALAAAELYGAHSVLFISKLKALASIRSDYDAMMPHYGLTAINYESCHKVPSIDYDLIVLDEAHSLGAFPKPSNRAKAVKVLCGRRPVIYLSGTPAPESFSQLYHQFWVSSYSPFAAWPNFYKWSKAFVRVTDRHVNGYNLKDYSDADKAKIDRCTKHLFIDYTQEQAGFCANIEETVLKVPMHDWTANSLRVLRRDRLIRWRGAGKETDTVVVADTPAKLMLKMHQLSSGTVIDEDGNHVVTDYSKAQFIRSFFAGRKIAVFYVYQSELDLLTKAFPRWTSSPEEFQNYDGTELVFLAQVRSAREGVRLDTADALIFFNMEYSFLSYEQGRNRLSSKERTSPARIYFLVSDCGIESDILEAVHGKSDFTASFFAQKHGGVWSR